MVLDLENGPLRKFKQYPLCEQCTNYMSVIFNFNGENDVGKL